MKWITCAQLQLLTWKCVTQPYGLPFHLPSHDHPLLDHLVLYHLPQEGRVGPVADGHGLAGSNEQPDGLAVTSEYLELRDVVDLGHGVGKEIVVDLEESKVTFSHTHYTYQISIFVLPPALSF